MFVYLEGLCEIWTSKMSHTLKEYSINVGDSLVYSHVYRPMPMFSTQLATLREGEWVAVYQW